MAAQITRCGGRRKGTPNKRTLELVERLEQLGLDPVAGLASVASDPAASLELRARCYESLMPYVYPKRKAIEMKVETGMTHEEWLTRLDLA